MGNILPGSTMLILGAVFAAQGKLSLPLVILLGWLGMFLGCCTDYWLGRAGLWWLVENTRSGARQTRIIVSYHFTLNQKGQTFQPAPVLYLQNLSARAELAACAT